MDSVILTLNAGSSSLKFAAFRLAERRRAESAGLGANRRDRRDRRKAPSTTAAGETTELSFDPIARAASIIRRRSAPFSAGSRRRATIHSVAAVGHRIVHGGPDYAEPVLIDDATLAKLQRAHSARAAPPAAQHRRRRSGDEGLSVDAAGRLLRHRLSSQPSVHRRHVRPAALLLRRGRAPLRLPRAVLRVHHPQAAQR